MAVKFAFCVLEPIIINFLGIFETELNINSRIANILNLDIFFVDIVDRNIKI